MASFVYNEAKRAIARGEIDLQTDDMRVALVMTNTTVDTENDGINFISNFATLDEFNGAGYVRKAISNETVTENSASDRADFSGDNVTWSAQAAGTRNIQGILLYKHVGADSANIPIAFFDVSAIPDGSDLIIRWNSNLSTSGDILSVI